MTTISIRTTQGARSVEALEVPHTRGVFATHRALAENLAATGFWSATHIPSGLMVPGSALCWTRQHAELLAQLLHLLLAEAGIDSRRDDLQAEVERYGAAFTSQIRERLFALAEALDPENDVIDGLDDIDPDTITDPDQVSQG
jgi:hypothetical protein